MTIEERLHNLELALTERPDETALASMRAFNAEVRNDPYVASLCSKTEVARSLGNEAAGAVYERRAIEALHTLAKRHLCPEAAAVFDPTPRLRAQTPRRRRTRAANPEEPANSSRPRRTTNPKLTRKSPENPSPKRPPLQTGVNPVANPTAEPIDVFQSWPTDLREKFFAIMERHPELQKQNVKMLELVEAGEHERAGKLARRLAHKWYRIMLREGGHRLAKFFEDAQAAQQN